MTSVLLAVLLILAGCELGGTGESLGECERIGAQCILPDGRRGVCESRPCPDDQQPPCFVCTPQH